MLLDSAGGIAGNLRHVQERVAAAARRAGREPSEVRLVAVTKTVPAEVVAAAVRLGIRRCGENRVQEAAAKMPEVRALLGGTAPPKWHLIGHLQTNKVQAALGLFDLIESVDSVRLAERISAEAGRGGQAVPILLEVNVTGEASKHGFLPDELPAAARTIASMPHIAIEGLMTVAPLAADAEGVRPVFRQLRQWRDQLRVLLPGVDWRDLSMGMSDDYEVAIEEGATIVRLGRAIFGERRAAVASEGENR